MSMVGKLNKQYYNVFRTKFCPLHVTLQLVKLSINFEKYIFTLQILYCLTLLHSERPKLYAILAFLSAIGLKKKIQNPNVKFTSMLFTYRVNK